MTAQQLEFAGASLNHKSFLKIKKAWFQLKKFILFRRSLQNHFSLMYISQLFKNKFESRKDLTYQKLSIYVRCKWDQTWQLNTRKLSSPYNLPYSNAIIKNNN
jgi:hypothetical protein